MCLSKASHITKSQKPCPRNLARLDRAAHVDLGEGDVPMRIYSLLVCAWIGNSDIPTTPTVAGTRRKSTGTYFQGSWGLDQKKTRGCLSSGSEASASMLVSVHALGSDGVSFVQRLARRIAEQVAWKGETCLGLFLFSANLTSWTSREGPFSSAE